MAVGVTQLAADGQDDLHLVPGLELQGQDCGGAVLLVLEETRQRQGY